MTKLFVLTLTVFSFHFNTCLARSTEIMGDWAFIKFAKDDCAGLIRSADLKHYHSIYGGNGSFLINVIGGPEVENLKSSVIYIFDNKTKITQNIYDYGEDDQKNELGFAPICVLKECYDPNGMIKNMRAGNSFTVNKTNGDLIAGPFSLKGSSKVIKRLEQKEKC